MLALSGLRLSARKWALRLYRAEQLQTNTTLDGLSAIQKRKVILRMFKGLSKEDAAKLKVRAVAYQARVEAGDRDPLSPVTQGSSGASAFTEITPYEFFVLEQKHNPAIASLHSPRAQEVKLLEIYKSLPEKAREALEQRAQERNALRRRGGTLGPAPGLRSAPGKGRQASRARRTQRKALAQGGKGAAAKSTANAEAAKGKKEKKVKVKRAVSPYAVFVKEQMPSVQDLPLKDRMKEIGSRWKALSEAERSARLSQSKTAKAAAAKAAIAEAVAAAVAESPQLGITPEEAPPAAPNEVPPTSS